MSESYKCIRFTEDPLNPGAGAGLCYDTHAGFGKTCLTCEEVIRTGRCRYGYKSPYPGNKGGKA